MRRSSTVAGTAALVLLLGTVTGCGLFDGGSDASTATTAAGRTTTSTATTSTTEPVAAPTVTLTDPGAEPRQALALAYRTGDQTTVRFTSDLAVEQTVDGRRQRLDSPPITQTLTYRVGTVTSRGARLTITVAAVAAQPKGSGLSPDEVAKIDAQLAPLVGLRATGLLAPDGRFTSLRFRVPTGLDQDLAAQVRALESQLGALAAPLPTEPVGVGATWTATSRSDIAGVAATATTTYTVTAVSADEVSYSMALTSTAEPQDLTLAGLASTTSARLTSSSITGSGTGTLSLRSPSFRLRSRVAGPQEIRLTDESGTTVLTQQVALDSSAATGAG